MTPQPKDNKTLIIVLIIVGALGLLGMLIGLLIVPVFFYNVMENERTDNYPSYDRDFTYNVDRQYPGDYSIGYYVEGTVKNETYKDYDYVQISFKCYDHDGYSIGTALANTTDLEGYETWRYKAVGFFSSTDVDHCEFDEITNW